MRVLLAVDASDATRKAVDFAGRVLAAGADVRLTVAHVVESLPDHFLLAPSRERLRSLADVWEVAAEENATKLLSEVVERLHELGVAPENIESKTIEVDALPESSTVSASMGLLAELRGGEYDVVCLGRRGTSPAGGSFVGSVAQHILREAIGVTVCVVD